MKTSTYISKVQFVFEGEFRIRACSPLEAREQIEKHCDLVLEGAIHTSLPNKQVSWEFPQHPEKKIISIRCS